MLPSWLIRVQNARFESGLFKPNNIKQSGDYSAIRTLFKPKNPIGCISGTSSSLEHQDNTVPVLWSLITLLILPALQLVVGYISCSGCWSVWISSIVLNCVISSRNFQNYAYKKSILVTNGKILDFYIRFFFDLK